MIKCGLCLTGNCRLCNGKTPEGETCACSHSRNEGRGWRCPECQSGRHASCWDPECTCYCSHTPSEESPEKMGYRAGLQAASELVAAHARAYPNAFPYPNAPTLESQIRALAGDGPWRPVECLEPDPSTFLAWENARLREAGCALAEAALRVARTYDGVHRLMLAVASWSQTLADEGGRGERYSGGEDGVDDS